ncbi:Small subunit processome component [Rhizopus stolonifer]|uniref:U three protein 23 n=1 Tax=Rhizopus stolonifer TaxID=4846 RepID=A0A367KX99_RHIST|nr:Small subunit processome component [Rhizopus stolonifer]
MTKASRTNKKIIHGYCVGFGFRPPFQVVVDGEFCKKALEKKIYVKDALPDLVGEKTRIVVTECILQDMKDKGHDFTSALILAKKFESRRCPHKDTKVSAYQCIRDLVGTDNKDHFFVASQNPKLRDRMRKIPGVPVLYVDVKHQGLGLEPMTDRSKHALKVHEEEKVKPLDKDTARLKRALLEEEAKKKESAPQHKKRKVKGVNPLAMKKKKKTPPPPKKK